MNITIYDSNTLLDKKKRKHENTEKGRKKKKGGGASMQISREQRRFTQGIVLMDFTLTKRSLER